jgi:hypothetical protein
LVAAGTTIAKKTSALRKQENGHNPRSSVSEMVSLVNPKVLRTDALPVHSKIFQSFITGVGRKKHHSLGGMTLAEWSSRKVVKGRTEHLAPKKWPIIELQSINKTSLIR